MSDQKAKDVVFKLILLSLAVFAIIFGLASCDDDISSYPTGYDEEGFDVMVPIDIKNAIQNRPNGVTSVIINLPEEMPYTNRLRFPQGSACYFVVGVI